MGASTSTLTRHYIVVALSQEAQQGAARAGQDARRLQVYDMPAELVGRALDMGAHVESDGSVVIAHRAKRMEQHDQRDGDAVIYGSRWREESGSLAALPRRPVDARDALDLIDQVRNAHQACVDSEAREDLRKALAYPVGESRYWLTHHAERARKGRLTHAELDALDARLAAEDVREREVEEAKLRARAGEARAVLEAYLASDAVDIPGDNHEQQRFCPDLYVKAKETSTERRKAAQAAKMAAEEARQRRLAALVRECSTDPLVLGRLDAPEGADYFLGLLPEDEAVEVVRAAKLPIPDTRVVDYGVRKLTARDARAECALDESDESDDGCPVSFASAVPDSLTPSEWGEAATIRSALKAAGLPEGELRLHTGTCECRCAAADAARRVGVLVRLDLGDGLVLKREYAVQS